ncbi:MAG: acetylglutamate kinase [Cytophagales bacterium]|nr:acetylglutamate kinase [Cytophagales bacterium]
MIENGIKVIKIGGNIIDDDSKLNNFLTDFVNIAGLKILVHGGGKLATELTDRLGVDTKMIDGRRVTDAETLKIVTMVYAGYINKMLVAKLQSLGCNAFGLSGADANTIPALKRNDSKIDWGYVGDLDYNMPDAANIKIFLDNHWVPVFCAITHDHQGNLLNTNADTIAACIASALAKKNYEVTLVYCFEKKGVLADINDENSVIKKINSAYYMELKDRNIVSKGMIPKLDNAFQSLKEGVHEVKICMAEDLHDFENAGTLITQMNI